MGAWAGGVAQLKIGRETLRDQKRANADLTRRMEGSQQAYEALRPFVGAARQEALRNVLGMYEPANQLLGEMTGGRYSLDLSTPANRWPSPQNMQIAAAQAAQDAQPFVPGMDRRQARREARQANPARAVNDLTRDGQFLQTTPSAYMALRGVKK